jgi:hypothetical protein
MPSRTKVIHNPSDEFICNPSITIKRPPNCFMIWSSEMRTRIIKKNSITKNAKISVVLGELWNNMSDIDKMKYVDEANKIKLEHKIKYPNCVYQPRRKRKHNNSNNSNDKENIIRKQKRENKSKQKYNIINKEIIVDIEEPDYYNELEMFYKNNIDIKQFEFLYEEDLVYDTSTYDL